MKTQTVSHTRVYLTTDDFVHLQKARDNAETACGARVWMYDRILVTDAVPTCIRCVVEAE